MDAVKLLQSINEPFAAGLLEYADGPLEFTYCRGYRRYFESCPIVYKKGAPLFPAGITTGGYSWEQTQADRIKNQLSVFPDYAHQYMINWEILESKSKKACDIMREYNSRFHYCGNWNHSMLNFKRILKEGISSYQKRLESKPDSNFKTALLDLIEGIRDYHRRALEILPSMDAPQKLIDAMKVVPFSPATNVYEAIVSLNFCLSLDGFDNIGRLDSILAPYHKGEDLREEIRCMFENMQENERWSVTLGPDYNDITLQAIEASDGLVRPLVELRVTENMPQKLWDTALRSILKGNGQPAFYNESAIQKRLLSRIEGLSEQDALEFSGGGCTETNFAGLTYAGGTDDNINVLKIFENFMYENLNTAKSFEDFYESFNAHLRQKQDEQMAQINNYWNERSKTCFAPIRSLFVDDCIENEKGWMQGGARYTFSICSDSGMPNTIDSLLAIRELVFEKKRYSADEFLKLLSAQDKHFFSVLKSCPAYGTGDKRSNELVFDFTSRFYAHYKSGKLDLGIGFLPTAHQFNRHVIFGYGVGPTPDGRYADMPEADSIAPVNEKAIKGPTVMLADAANYEQKDIYGIAVTNLSITRKYPPQILKSLIEGYFKLGGTQLQITVADKNVLLEARKNPEKHRNLIVRVGGYSEYFCNLSDDLKDAVIARTMFDI